MDSSNKIVLITGGCGYIGNIISQQLVKLKYQVVLYDLRLPQDFVTSSGVSFIQGDICNLDQMTSALASSGACSVIHCAGFGLSGTSNLPAFNGLTRKVNVTGTEVVMEACLRNNVTNLVFTSTVNVAFSGQEIIGGNEESHRWLEKSASHCDVYSRSKQEAEIIVIKSNGKINKFGNKLKTCTLRLAGVYGPGEQIILGRSVKLIRVGIARDTFSSKENLLIDFVHIKNVVQAHIKALHALEVSDSANGQIFNITDDNPTDLSFFLNPLYAMVTDEKEQKLPKPKIFIPVWISHFISRCFALMSIVFGKRFILPFWGFTVMETYKISTDHFFSITKARKVLGYNPIPCGQEDWTEIKNSLRTLKNPPSSNSSNLFRKMSELVRSMFSYTIFILCSLCFYIILFGSYIITLGF